MTESNSPRDDSRAPLPGIELAFAIDEPPSLRLDVEARLESAAIVRRALSGVAESCALPASLLADMKTAVSEACNNVVLHAYRDGAGPLGVALARKNGNVEVVVTDQGEGFDSTRVANGGLDLGSGAEYGMGLALIGAICDDVDIDSRPGQGTEVRLTFSSDEMPPAAEGPNDTLAAAVVAQVIGIVAAEAGFTLDRLGDAQLVADAVCARVVGFLVDESLRVGIGPSADGIELSVAPLEVGGASQLVRSSTLPGVGPLVERLVDDVKVDATAGATEEQLRLVLLRER
jgi:anti-sigma regulatory factor (Ser/Thr protein kinase)